MAQPLCAINRLIFVDNRQKVWTTKNNLDWQPFIYYCAPQNNNGGENPQKRVTAAGQGA